MCEVGVRLRLPPGTVFSDGSPVTPGAHGTVIGHRGPHAIVSVDERPSDNVLVLDTMVRPLRGSSHKPVIIMPGGKVHPLSRSWPRARTRR